MAGKAGQKKRVWSDEEKRSICAQARAEGVSVAQVARRYEMNTNLIHKWLRDPRFGAGPGDAVEMAEPPCFLPVELEGPACPSLSAPTDPLSAQRVDITLSDGRRILVEGATGLPAVLALVEGLMA